MVNIPADFIKRWQTEFRIGDTALHWKGEIYLGSFVIADRKVSKATGRKVLADEVGNLYPIEECTKLPKQPDKLSPVRDDEVADVIDMIASAQDDDVCAIAVEEALTEAFPTIELKKQLWEKLPQESKQLLYRYRAIAQQARGEVAA